MLQRDKQTQRLYLHDVVAISKIETTKVGEVTPSTTETATLNDSLYMTSILQRAYNVKVVFDKANGGKHGLGRVVIDDLPYQFTKPLAITGNTSQHQQLGDNSIVVWTDWQTEDGNAIIVPIRVDVNGQVGLYNNVNSVFDAYDQKYVADLLRNENILYTENNRDIQELLNAQGREVPKSQATNVSTDILSHQKAESKTSTQKNQSRDDDYMTAVNRGDMETAQKDIRFSMRNNVEETRDLVAVHNMTHDSNIRIAPTFPSPEDLDKAMDIFCVCTGLAAAEKLPEA